MSVSPAERDRPSDTIAGLLSAAAIAVGLVAIAYRPVRLAPPAIVLALVAAGIGGRHGRLAAVAVTVATVGWFVGMVLAVITHHRLF